MPVDSRITMKTDKSEAGQAHNRNTLQAVAVQIDQQQQPTQHQPPVVQVVYQPSSVVIPTVGGNGDVQCCYPITIADPAEEMVRARNVAIVHVCVEAAALLFCRSAWCVLAVLFAIPSSSTVACCCKRRGSYICWSVFGGLVFFLHAVAATTEALKDDQYFEDPYAFIFTVQIALCLLSLLVTHYGIKLASLLREPVFPIEAPGRGMEVTPQIEPYQPSGVPWAQAGLLP